ncbi:MAG: hypothetical protein ACR2OB_05215 [Solirubrobacteraceae bacterium]
MSPAPEGSGAAISPAPEGNGAAISPAPEGDAAAISPALDGDAAAISPALDGLRAPASATPSRDRTLLGRAQALDPRLLAGLALVAACALGLTLGLLAGVVGVRAVPAVLRTAAVAIAFFALCGYGAARVLVRGEITVHRPLLVLPLGAAVSSLALAVLGVLHVPLKVSLAIVIAGALAASVRVHRTRRGTERTQPAGRTERTAIVRVLLPLALAGMVGLISLLPIFRAGYATIPGQNGDAILAVGTATLLQHAPPTATRTDLPINHVPFEWRSKYPIYYALAAIATLAGQDPIQAFATLSALMLALTALGFFLFARYMLRAPPWAALLALLIVPLDRIVMYVTIHPYYNELWGQFALPFMLLAGWRYLHAPGRASATLFALFGLLALLAYPLVIPFPAIFLVVYGWGVRRRARAAGQPVGWVSQLRLPRPRARPWMWIPVAVIGIPVFAVLIRGFLEKTTGALGVIFPWTSLAGWHGSALPYLPWPRFIGMPESAWAGVALILVCVLAWRGLTRVPDQVRRPLAAMVVVTALIGVYFRVRYGGELFFFKDLAFLGPFVLMLALVELCALAIEATAHRAVLGLSGLALALALVPASAAREIDQTYEQATSSVLGLRAWNRALPRSSSVRNDVRPGGYQLWVTYMFKDHPLSALDPLGGFFPHPAYGRKADYVIASTDEPRPPDATGPSLRHNAQFVLWRMNPSVPGPDVSSRYLRDDGASLSIK